MRPNVPRVVNVPTFMAPTLSHLFFRFGGGRPLHTAQSLIVRGLMEVPTTCFATSSYKAFLMILLSVVLLPRRNRLLEPWFLIQVMLSGFAWRLFPNVHLFEVPLATLSLARFFCRLCSIVGPVWPHSLRHATPAWRFRGVTIDGVWISEWIYWPLI
jgi:hypothetical protein